MYDEIVMHARADAPDECCGIVSVDGERAAPRSPRRPDRIGTGVFARLRPGSRRRRLLSTRFLGTR